MSLIEGLLLICQMLLLNGLALGLVFTLADIIGVSQYTTPWEERNE
jgi:hypothetical protein